MTEEKSITFTLNDLLGDEDDPHRFLTTLSNIFERVPHTAAQKRTTQLISRDYAHKHFYTTLDAPEKEVRREGWPSPDYDINAVPDDIWARNS